ncbi:hypothetical protein KIPB_011007, partial [Kipferlia bialata]|eukprot:g11007.t1
MLYLIPGVKKKKLSLLSALGFDKRPKKKKLSLLSALGFDKRKFIGTDETTGVTAPVETQIRKSGAGLGLSGASFVAESTASTAKKAKKSTFTSKGLTKAALLAAGGEGEGEKRSKVVQPKAKEEDKKEVPAPGQPVPWNVDPLPIRAFLDSQVRSIREEEVDRQRQQ